MRKADLILSDAILSHQIDLFRFTAGERKKVLALLQDMEKDLKVKIMGDLTDFGKARTYKLLKECREVINKYYADMGTQIDLPGLAQTEAQFTTQTFATIGLEASLPTEAALKSIVNDALIEGSPISEWWEKQAADTQFRFANQVRQGIAQGETLQEIIRRVAGSKRLGTVGIMDVSRRNASALVHTSIQTIANDASLATYRANADILKGVRHLSTLDSHTSLTCIARSGKEWDLNGNPIGGHNFPFQNCPLHWNCRSTIIGITKTYRELGVDIDEVPKGTRASDLGQIPADTSFSGFLNRHDTKYQDELLGPGRAKLWREGKITLSQLVDQTGRELTLAQLKEIAH